MNRTAIAHVLALALTATTAGAQDRGDFTVFAKYGFDGGLPTPPVGDALLGHPSLGMAYQATSRLELRPVLGFGRGEWRDAETGEKHGIFDYTVGVRPLYSFYGHGRRFVAYAGGELTFSHVDNSHPNYLIDQGHLVLARTPPPPPGWSANNVIVGTAIGARYWVTRRIGLFAETGISWAVRPRYVWTGSAWQENPTHRTAGAFRPGFGLMFNLH